MPKRRKMKHDPKRERTFGKQVLECLNTFSVDWLQLYLPRPRRPLPYLQSWQALLLWFWQGPQCVVLWRSESWQHSSGLSGNLKMWWTSAKIDRVAMSWRKLTVWPCCSLSFNLFNQCELRFRPDPAWVWRQFRSWHRPPAYPRAPLRATAFVKVVWEKIRKRS